MIRVQEFRVPQIPRRGRTQWTGDLDGHVDNYGTHKTQLIQKRFAKRPRKCTSRRRQLLGSTRSDASWRLALLTDRVFSSERKLETAVNYNVKSGAKALPPDQGRRRILVGISPLLPFGNQS
jgi:hypothetical protein